MTPSDSPTEWLTTVFGFEPDPARPGFSLQQTFFDVNRAGLCDRRWLVSRKRTRNLFDAAQTWKRCVLDQVDNDRDDSPDYWAQLSDIDVDDTDIV